MKNQNITEIEEFFDGQEMYATVIRENYMMHKEVIQWIKTHCANRFGKNIRVLEVGCGDAYVVSKLVQDIDIASYVGIDLSANALKQAKKYLYPLLENIELLHGDIAEIMMRLEGKFDIILAGFVLHHFQAPEKRRIFDTFKKLLSENGALIFYDVTMSEGDTREQYNSRTVDYYDVQWTELNFTQLRQIREHVLSFDFPEAHDTWVNLATAAGLRLSTSDYLDGMRFYRISDFT